MISKLKSITIFVTLIAQLFTVKSLQKTTVLISRTPKFHDADEMSPFERLDSKLIEAFAKKYKLDIEYISANVTLNEKFGTEAGIKRLLESIRGLKIDIFIGALEENLITKKYLVASRPYYHDCLTWCVQRHQPIPRWQSAFLLCTDTRVYIAFSIFAFCTIGCAYFLQKTEPNKKDWHYITLLALTICIGYSHPYQAKNNPTRVLISVGQLAGTILCTLVTSMLLLRVSIPHYLPQIDSIAEIEKNSNGDFVLAGDRFALQKLSQQREEYSTKLLQNFEIFIDPNIYLRRLEWDNKLAVAVSREQIRNDETLSRMHIYCFETPNHIYEYPMRILTAKKFRYSNELNRFIEMTSESGLIGKWLRGIQFGQFGEEKTSLEYSIVDMEVFVVVMLLLILFFLFSTYVLYVERAMDKREKNKSNTRFYQYVKMLVDPDRHFFMDDFENYDTSECSKRRK